MAIFVDNFLKFPFFYILIVDHSNCSTSTGLLFPSNVMTYINCKNVSPIPIL